MKSKEEANYRFNLKENRETLKTTLKVTLFLTVFLFCYLLVSLLVLQIYSNFTTEKAKFFYFEKSPDLVAVFTGDKGRIDLAFKILEQYPESKLLISGVYNKNTLRSLLTEKNMSLSEEQLAQVVEIDYLSKNTFDNVLATIQEVKKDPSIKNILVISSDYHLLRINLLFYFLKDEETTFQVHYMGVDSQSQFIGKLIDSGSEGLKIFKSLMVSMFLDREEIH